MRSMLRDGTSWLGRKVHPVRLVIEIICAIYAFWQVGILFSVFFARLTYPMDLEWMEGGTLYEAYRLLHGLPLYVRPIPTWAPYPYPPAHTALVALVGCLHLDFWTGRLVSIFLRSGNLNPVILPTRAAITAAVRRRSSSRYPAARLEQPWKSRDN